MQVTNYGSALFSERQKIRNSMRSKPRGPRAQAENVFEAENASAVAGSAALEGREPQRPGGHRRGQQTDLFRSLFRALRPPRDEEIMEIFAPRGRSQNFAEF